MKSLFALVACLALVGLNLPSYELLAFNQHLFLAVTVLGLNFALGLGGQVSLAHGAFCGLGAYGSTLLHGLWPGGGLVILPGLGLAVFLLGALLSRPIEKLGEGFLAMATLGLGLIFTNLLLSLESLTGGPAGLMVDHPLTLLGRPVQGDLAYFLLFLGLLLVGGAVFLRLRDSRPGRALLACKDDPAAASACGVERGRCRALAFGLGAALAALAGALYAHLSGFISPKQFDLELSSRALLYLVIGGPGHLLRPVLAVLVLETVLAKTQFLGEARTLVSGLLLAAALLVGIWSERRALPLPALPRLFK